MSKRGFFAGLLVMGAVGAAAAAGATVFVAQEMGMSPRALVDKVMKRGTRYVMRKTDKAVEKVERKLSDLADAATSDSESGGGGANAAQVAEAKGAAGNPAALALQEKEADLKSVARRQWTEDGATRSHYNAGAGLTWENRLGDWRDAAGKAQGDKAFAQVRMSRGAAGAAQTWDVSKVVQDWQSGAKANLGFLLRAMPGSKGTNVFHSRESKDKGRRPVLEVQFAGGGKKVLPAVADTYIAGSTFKALGNQREIKVGGTLPILVRFNLGPVRKQGPVTKATLKLFATQKQFGSVVVGAFLADSGQSIKVQAPVMGLAKDYPWDRGITQNPDVLFAADFESDSWDRPWKLDQNQKTFEPVAKAPKAKFVPLAGRALQVAIPKGQHLGLNIYYMFKEQLGEEPEEIYFRYYLRLGDTWNQTRQGGKMPGIAGTYNRAGWGGRRANGTNGWSMRGSYNQSVTDRDNPLVGTTAMGNYAYYADMPNPFGNVWVWSGNGLGALKRNMWYSIEQHVKLNTPGKNDGVLQVWIDGRPALDRSDIRYRDTDALKIDRIWMNVYHGGTAVSPHLQELFFDNVVISKAISVP